MQQQIKRFTQDIVSALKPSGDGDQWIQDPAFPGFYVRFQKGGEGTYFIRYTVHGQRRKLPLGKVSRVKLADAQKEARKHFGSIAEKVDPAIERAKASVSSGVTMVTMLGQFEAFMRNKRRSEDYIGRTLGYLKGTKTSAYFRPLHIIPLAQLNRATVARELSNIEESNGPVTMTRARAALSHFIKYCYTQGHEFANPVEGTVKYTSDNRDRVLQPEELRVIWQTAGEDDYGQCVKLIMLTAARRTQIGSLNRKEMFLDASEAPMQDRLIAFPGQGKRTSRKGGSKNTDTFYMPLPRQVLAILTARTARKDNDHVFGKGGGGFSGWSASKERHEGRIKRLGHDLEQWGLHDIRTSFQTLGQDLLDLDGTLLDTCLNHKSKTKGGARAHYDFAKLLRKRREAHQAWADWIENLVSGTKLKIVKAA